MYRDEVFEHKEAVIESIVQTFESKISKNFRAISFIEERLFLLDNLMDAIQYDQALRILTVYENMIKYS